MSYGDPQTVAVWAKRALTAKKMVYSINGGKPVKTDVTEWAGGERYGFENVDYYAEYRGVVTGASPGDSVEVWFTATATGRDLPKGQKAGPVASEHFTYEVAQDSGRSVLVVANEDYTGVNPTYPAGTDAPKYVDEHVAALEANGVTPDVWDVDAQGVPHDLGVLGHYDAIVGAVSDLSAGRPARPEAAEAMRSLAEALRVDATGELAEAEYVSNAAVMLFGGIETTEGMIANAVVHLLEHGRAGAPLEDVVEESLRLEPAAAAIDRGNGKAADAGGLRVLRASQRLSGDPRRRRRVDHRAPGPESQGRHRRDR